jgi:hypothetical protein
MLDDPDAAPCARFEDLAIDPEDAGPWSRKAVVHRQASGRAGGGWAMLSGDPGAAAEATRHGTDGTIATVFHV